MSEEEECMELDGTCLRCSRHDDSMKLLVCSVTGCSIAVHVECMCSEPEIDEAGRFCCPYCAHKRAVVRMEKLRRKALRAKEVLSMFIKSREANGAEGDEIAVRNVGGIEGSGTENEEMEMDDNVSEGNAVDGIEQGDGDDVRENGGKKLGAMEVDEVVPDSGDCQGGTPLLRKKRYKKKAQRVQVQRVIPVMIVSSPVKKPSSCQTEAVEEDVEKQNENGTSCAVSSKSSEVPVLNQDENAGTSSEFRKSQELNQNEKVATSCFDINEVAELHRNVKATNNLSSESRGIPEPSHNEKATEILSDSRKVTDLNQSEKTSSSTEPIKLPKNESEELLFHHGGRKRVNWTSEELKALKEGVLFYSSQVNKNLPWRKVLERGSHIFHKTRTPSNLKDKWQVLCREASNKRQT